MREALLFLLAISAVSAGSAWVGVSVNELRHVDDFNRGYIDGWRGRDAIVQSENHAMVNVGLCKYAALVCLKDSTLKGRTK